MDDAQALATFSGLFPGEVLSLLTKGTLICFVGLFIGSELSLMSAAVRHRIALGTVICLAMLPLMGWSALSWELPILPREVDPGESVLWRLNSVLMPPYLAVIAVLLTRLAIDTVRTARLSARATYAGTAAQLLPGLQHSLKHTRIKFSDEIRSPLTWGQLGPVILLPQDADRWDTRDLRMVLQHELSHVERADWMGHLIGRCVHALYWPVPGIRRLLRQLSLAAEQACDDRVLGTGVPAPDYAAMLLRQARGTRVPATVSLGHGSELGIRIRYLVAEIADHSVFATSTGTTLLACVMLTAPLAGMQLGNRPELPELVWGSARQPQEAQATQQVSSTPRLNDSVLAALRPGPERPNRPATVELPPKFNPQEKPTIPPP